MDGLHCAMSNAVNSGLICGIKLGSSGIVLSHLFYADDVIITTDWNPHDIDNIIRVLHVFHLASGHKINIHKSNIFCIGVSNDEILSMASRTGCAAGCFPFTYLGLPIGANMNLTSSWQILIDRFQKSLKAFNLALLQKWRWRLFSSPNDMWVNVIKALHGQEGVLNNQGYSFNGGMRHSCSFLERYWIGDSPLHTRYNRLYRLDQDSGIGLDVSLIRSFSPPFRHRLCRINFFHERFISLLTMATTSVPHWWKYDVFVSFRGDDIRKSFMDHLFNDFKQKGIHAFRDDLPKGEEISPELSAAIERSRPEVDNWKEALSTAANLSGWDLEDMTNGYEYKFIYCISKDILNKLCDRPLHVGENLVGIDCHFDKLDLSRFVGSDKVNMIGLCGVSGIGKTTLAKAIYNLMYIHFEGSCFCEDVRKQQNLTRVQMQLIDNIMKTRSLKILTVGQGIMVIKKMMSSKPILLILDDVDDHEQLEALAGSAGWFCPGSLIIFTVETGRQKVDQLPEALGRIKSLTKLRVDRTAITELPSFVSSLINHESLSFGGQGRIQPRWWTAITAPFGLLSKQQHPLRSVSLAEALAGSAGWFCPGSLIIFTGKDKRLLRSHRVDEIRDMDFLDKDRSLELFCSYAFKEKDSSTEFKEVSQKVVKYVQGHPLALKVLGRFLYDKTVGQWISELEKLKVYPNEQIQRVLRLSYDGLDLHQKNILLDIACLFVGENMDFVASVLDGCNFFAVTNMQVLVDKSLITISSKMSLQMHDLIQAMARAIVREESIVTGKQRRLWNSSLVYNVLSEKKVPMTETIEVLVLLIRESSQKITSLEELDLEGCVNLVSVYPSIGMLKRLVVLNLSNCKQVQNFPSRVETGCQKVDQLPEALGRIKSLTKLHVDRTAITELPSFVSSLINHESLSFGGQGRVQPRWWTAIVGKWVNPNTVYPSFNPSNPNDPFDLPKIKSTTVTQNG
nr:NB-ARC domains-containing protein [Tanacetum cinerariifolium]